MNMIGLFTIINNEDDIMKKLGLALISTALLCSSFSALSAQAVNVVNNTESVNLQKQILEQLVQLNAQKTAEISVLKNIETRLAVIEAKQSECMNDKSNKDIEPKFTPVNQVSTK